MKKLLAATVAAVMFTGAAHAQNMFARMGDQGEGISTVIIDPLNATGDGYVAVYEYHNDEVGMLLGVASISAGANLETRVQVGRPLRRDIIAFLFVGDDFSDPSQAVDSVEIDIE